MSDATVTTYVDGRMGVRLRACAARRAPGVQQFMCMLMRMCVCVCVCMGIYVCVG